jgi:anthranilate 1,2-dioxygenase ferredoxin subunit
MKEINFMNEIVLGTIEQFAKFPAEVRVEHQPFFLMEADNGYKLISRICPHAGDTVELEGGELVCPMHGWTFEFHTGSCHHIPNVKLRSHEVHLRDGNLVVQMP